nr:hypothetical protein [Nocardioides sp. B-3]
MKPSSRSSSPVAYAAPAHHFPARLAVRRDRVAGRVEGRELGGDATQVRHVATLPVHTEHGRVAAAVVDGGLCQCGGHLADLRLVDNVAVGDRDAGEVLVAQHGRDLGRVGAEIATHDDLTCQLLAGHVGHDRLRLLELADCRPPAEGVFGSGDSSAGRAETEGSATVPSGASACDVQPAKTQAMTVRTAAARWVRTARRLPASPYAP